MVKMRRVKSKNIRSIGYRPDPAECDLCGTMYIEFMARPGVIYFANGVPVELWNGLLEKDVNKESVGSYFAKEIKPKYKFVVRPD